MIASVSHIKGFITCPQAAYNRYVLRRAGHGLSKSLEVGTLVHTALERKVCGAADWWDDTLAEALLHGTEWREIIDQFVLLKPILEDWHLSGQYEVVATEQELALPLGPHTVIGRLDLVLRDVTTGWLWHNNHKTVDDSKNLGTEAERMRTDWHEAAYAAMGRIAYPTQFWAGSMASFIRKISLKAINDEKRGPRTGWAIYSLMVDDDITNRSLDDIKATLDRMEQAYADPDRLLRNRSACINFGICPYKMVCDGITRLDNDDRFQSLEPRYANFDAS